MGKLCFACVPTVEWDGILRNKEECKRRGFPKAVAEGKRGGRLAVVGGGPSVLSHLDKIRECEEVWAINGACQMLKAHGIESTLFSMDPDPIVTKWARGATKALLCDRVCPEAFDALEGADIRVFELVNDSPDGVYAGSSTASGAFSLGVNLGFSHIDFFGCESSFEDQTHAYQDEKREHLLWVECGGKTYKTAPDFYLQAQEMSMILRHFPKHYRAFGGGLLQALTDSPDHDVTHVSRALMATLTPVEAECLPT